MTATNAGTLHRIADEVAWVALGQADIVVGCERLLAKHAAFDDYLRATHRWDRE